MTISVGIPYYGASEKVMYNHFYEIVKSSVVPDEIIVVNDGHPNDLRILMQDFHIEYGIKMTYAKILVDIPWNYQMANLCWYLCESEFISIEDCDVYPTKLFYEQGLNWLIEGYDKFTAGYVNEASRPAACGIYRRAMLEKLGGWDEDFSGHYGLVDIWLNALIDRNGYKTYYSEEKLLYRNIDGETRGVVRDDSRNRELLLARLNGVKGEGGILREKFEIFTI